MSTSQLANLKGGISIPTVAADVLRRASVAGDAVKLPADRLPCDTYQACDKVLRALGGKWNRARGAHVFPAPIGDRLAAALDAGRAVDERKANQQFFTPPSLAGRLIEIAAPQEGEHALEPSAGEGALMAGLIQRGCLVTAVERDRALAVRLAERFAPMHGGGLWCADFLSWQPAAARPFDLVLMNPPFTRGEDMVHVERAFGFLRRGGRLVAIMSPHHCYATSNAAARFRAWLTEIGARVEDVPAGAFRAAGTEIATCIVTATKRDLAA